MSDDQRWVISLEEREWMGREELSEHLDVSPRTLTAMIHRGDVERRQGPEGPEYRYLGEVDGPGGEPVESAAADTPGVELQATTLITVPLKEWTATRESLVRAEVELQGSRRDVERAVEYAQALEEEIAYTQGMVQELEQIRGRAFLEAGRRAQAEEAREELEAEVAQLQEEVRRLRAALSAAEERGLKAKLGGLKVEIKI